MQHSGGSAAPSDREAAREPGSLPSESYAAALRRFGSSLGRRNLHEALAALDAAIALEPDLAAPHHTRAQLWRLLGDYVRAAHERARCLSLDPHQAEREVIQRAAGQLSARYAGDPVVDARWERAACRSPELHAVLEARAAAAARRCAAFDRPSCSLPCPSLCCYFEEETFACGVHLDEGELAAVRGYLREAGLREEEHLARIERTSVPVEYRTESGWFVRDGDGREYLHYPRLGQRRVEQPAGLRPKTCQYSDLPWLTSRSRGCVFIREWGCAVHDVGDPPGLAVCRGFLCLTAFVFIVLRDLGLVTPEELAQRSMSDLHEAALSALPWMADALCSPEIAAVHADMRAALGAAIDADASGSANAVREALQRYAAAHAVAKRLEASGREALAARVRPPGKKPWPKQARVTPVVFRESSATPRCSNTTVSCSDEGTP